MYLQQLNNSKKDRHVIWRRAFENSLIVSLSSLPEESYSLLDIPWRLKCKKLPLLALLVLFQNSLRRKLLISPISITPLYTLVPICPSDYVSEIFLALLLGDGLPSISLPPPPNLILLQRKALLARNELFIWHTYYRFIITSMERHS